MRVLHNPFKALKNIFSPAKPKLPQVDTVAEDAAKAREAQDEASRKTRAAASNRAGGRSTFLTAPRLGETFGDLKTKKTTLGVN